jgi:hypothetical protein
LLIKVVSSRVTWYQIWSPNATVHDIYPGTLIEPIPTRTQSSFVDSRLGPSDWSLHPQHFSPHRPWLPFCVRPPSRLEEWRGTDPELVPLPLIASVERGVVTLRQDYADALQARGKFLLQRVAYLRQQLITTKDPLASLLEDELAFPREDHLCRLCSSKGFSLSKAVCMFVTIQRGLREQAAFVDMMEYWPLRLSTGRQGVIDCSRFLRGTSVSKQRVGCYLNGADELDAKWLLQIDACPVHVVHRYSNYADFNPTIQQFKDSSTVFRTFAEGTPLYATLAAQYYSFVHGNKPVQYRRPEARHLPQWRHPVTPSLSGNNRSAPWAGHLRPPSYPKPPSGLTTYVASTYSRPHSELVIPPSSSQGAWGSSWGVSSVSHSTSNAWSSSNSSSSNSWGTSSSRTSTSNLTSDPWGASWSVESSNSNTSWGSASPSTVQDVPLPPRPVPQQQQPIGTLVATDEGQSYWVPPPVHKGPESRKVGNGKKSKSTWTYFRQEDCQSVEFKDGRSVEGVIPMKINGKDKRKMERQEGPGDSDEEDDAEGQNDHYNLDEFYPRVCYARHTGRQLKFEQPLPRDPRVHFDPRIYGFPLPNNLMFYVEENGYAVKRGRSTWAYYTPRPHPKHAGKALDQNECQPRLRKAATPASQVHPSGTALPVFQPLTPVEVEEVESFPGGIHVNIHLEKPPLEVELTSLADITAPVEVSQPLASPTEVKETEPERNRAPSPPVPIAQVAYRVTRNDQEELDWGEDEWMEFQPSAPVKVSDEPLIMTCPRLQLEGERADQEDQIVPSGDITTTESPSISIQDHRTSQDQNGDANFDISLEASPPSDSSPEAASGVCDLDRSTEIASADGLTAPVDSVSIVSTEPDEPSDGRQGNGMCIFIYTFGRPCLTPARR